MKVFAYDIVIWVWASPLLFERAPHLAASTEEAICMIAFHVVHFVKFI